MAAYGENGKWEGRAERVLEELRDVEVHCLSTTQGEYPVHPLQQRGRRLTDHVLYRGDVAGRPLNSIEWKQRYDSTENGHVTGPAAAQDLGE